MPHGKYSRTAAALIGLTLPFALVVPAEAEQAVGVGLWGTSNGSVLAVNATGTANSGAIAVSGSGHASGGTAGITGVGSANGGTLAVDNDRTTGMARRQFWDTLYDTTGVLKLGLNAEDNGYQAWVIATAPPPDAASVAEKMATYTTEVLPATAYNMATMVNVPMPSSPEQAAASAASSPAAANSVPEIGMAPGSPEVTLPYGCAAETLAVTYRHHGMPSQAHLYNEMGLNDHDGATLTQMHAMVRKYYRGAGQPHRDADAGEPVEFMARITTAIARYWHGAILAIDPALAPHWRGTRGGASGMGHAVNVTLYWHGDGGHLWVSDGASNNRSQPGPSFGMHSYSLHDVWLFTTHGMIW